jgi:hypothetical protein
MQAHKEERKLYSQKRQARIKALLQRAKELGLDAPQDEGDGAEG